MSDFKPFDIKKQIENPKTLVMGILNLTDDSFSDGGRYNQTESAILHVKDMILDGANIIDIGAESTRPNARRISVEEEIERLKILKSIVNVSTVPISIDTYKPEVAEYAINQGVDIINDVEGMSIDMAKVAKDYDKTIVATHNRKFKGDVIEDIKKFFSQSNELADEVGLSRRNLIFDPGIGFNKTQEQNLEVLHRLNELREFKLLLGVSRKSVIGYATGFEIDERDESTGAICAVAITQGVKIVRVHNVKMIAKMCRTVDEIYSLPRPKS